MVEKIKNLFVVTLDDGKKTYFDFVDGKIYGVSGKVVQNFNAEAKKILKSEQDDNFLAMYFYERTLTRFCHYNLKNGLFLWQKPFTTCMGIVILLMC